MVSTTKATTVLLALTFVASIAMAQRPFPAGLRACLYDDFRQLEAFYDATNGNAWSKRDNWFDNPDLSTWCGVTLTTDGCNVQAIKMPNNRLSGTLANLANLDLAALRELDLSQNQITGVVPNFQLPSLQKINLSSNLLSGNLPSLVACRSLTEILLSNNRFVGNIPTYNLPNLQTLVLSINQLTGSIPNMSLPKLVSLDLNRNRLSGNMPIFTSSNFPELTLIDISSNQLTGSIPANLPFSLKYLYLASNLFAGTIPSFDLPNLQNLVLSRNQLSGNLPSFALCPSLKSIVLFNNALTGTLSNANLSELLNLETLDISNNQLTGAIPNFRTSKMKFLALANNRLSGTIPTFTYVGLQQLFLENNLLEGNIPNLSLLALNEINLSNNRLVGAIPNFNLPNMRYMYLNENQLSGNIPNMNCPNLIDFFIQNNKFTFGDMVGKRWLSATRVRYAPQAEVTLTYNGLTARIDMGGYADAGHTFKWFRNGVLVATTNSSSFNVPQRGVYTCQVTHNTLTVATDSTRNLILTTRLVEVTIINTSTTENQEKAAPLSMYPNPAVEWVNIKFNNPNNETASLEVHNLMGQIVHRQIIDWGGEYGWKPENVATGIYIVTVRIANKQQVGTLMIK